MDYRDILGIPKKHFKKKVEKKVEKKAPKKPTPQITENLKKQFGPLHEGPAYDYAQQWDNVKKTYGAFWDSVHDLEDLLQSKGMGRDAKKVNQMYKKNVEGFYKYIYKLIGKLM